ncbi:NYN domain-containing protein [Tenacibaculum dicentrarchi]|uniref:NYN domain-containing protein n=1 Tax=Tenacibaculum dicentrarchi TaxID=669041 RepID=UPI001BEB5CEB|nr:NYN domain-containing protein [Tenacibaculum dicentrarchi]MCD8418960.1 NYN domain-containing protein [Tenacibaculum dicentrarchi]MCD8436706.1 NYN domain-containing protein [Tenacibaculum dicentrarchi]MCD8450767.1 NYN domain-containing protein [Tenacibaculum dicentrarchi]MCG8826866.1 NYN domain-containing protein [Tenacibaculum dicentrarchi]
MENKFNIAVLIDGDNAQPKLLKEIIEEVSKYGKATIRRIYGDWTTPQMNSWKAIINQHSISPIQKFSYTTGKNSTDGSLIIDAMDILHGKNTEGFCIVSSDSDYTGLAKRIREEGLFVMGIGEKKTPEAFVKSCEVFTFTENLKNEQVIQNQLNNQNETVKSKSIKQNSNIKNKTIIEKIRLSRADLKTINKAFDISTNEEENAYISTLGVNIRKIDPSFDPRSYGFKNLTRLFENIDKYEVIKNEVGGLNHPLLRIK